MVSDAFISLLIIVTVLLIYRKNSATAFYLAILYCLALTFFQFRSQVNESYFPPQGTVSLNFFLNEKKINFICYRLKKNDSLFYELIPDPDSLLIISNLLSFRFGMPSYIFDRNGFMIDWSINADDDIPFIKKWKELEDEREISNANIILRTITEKE
jgi:hypothetical protein